ncbi:MAG TPA: DMT family transporter [Candidatus Desulfovibrio intestinavium]|uniref:DMT family transporter n=1 Tax=Candidatus Desulfovibrio intestinavium TaxID=2838534 RepID=A0A9D2HP44_9BACT|nr:DMT family transporter [Candidatus Desulfovibrio intestinavium]
MTLGNNAAGLLLALLTALFWGALPLAVKHVLPVMDAVTLVWLRFCVAAVWIWLIPAPGRRLRTAAPAPVVPPPPRLPLRRACLLLFVATAGLGANFVFFNSSVAYLSASACQILAQAGPVLLLLGGVFILREAFLPIQGVGVALLLAGLLLFFNTRLGLLWGGDSNFAFGMLLGASAALVWATYGLAQKVLLRHLTPTSILRVIYPCCALGLTPLASPAAILRVDAVQGACLAFACLNTLVAYGAFTKAMSIWHAAKVSAVVATTPLFSLVLESLLHALFPHAYPLESVGLLSLAGACVVVLGALGIAVGPMLHLPHLPRRRRRGDRRCVFFVGGRAPL